MTFSRSWLAAVMATLVAVGATACSDSGNDAATTRATTTTQAEPPPTEVQSTKPPPAPAKPPTGADQKDVYAELARLRDRGVSGDNVYRRAARDAGLPVSSVKLIERQGSLRRWALPRAPKPPPAAVRAGRPWGATRLHSKTSCSQNAPRTAIAHLRWRPAKTGRTQWIVVTNLLRGFEFGKFEAAGPLKPKAASFDWRRVHGQSIHQWRVLTWDGHRWLGSPTAKFTGPTCVAEFEP